MRYQILFLVLPIIGFCSEYLDPKATEILVTLSYQTLKLTGEYVKIIQTMCADPANSVPMVVDVAYIDSFDGASKNEKYVFDVVNLNKFVLESYRNVGGDSSVKDENVLQQGYNYKFNETAKEGEDLVNGIIQSPDGCAKINLNTPEIKAKLVNIAQNPRQGPLVVEKIIYSQGYYYKYRFIISRGKAYDDSRAPDSFRVSCSCIPLANKASSFTDKDKTIWIDSKGKFKEDHQHVYQLQKNNSSFTGGLIIIDQQGKQVVV